MMLPQTLQANDRVGPANRVREGRVTSSLSTSQSKKQSTSRATLFLKSGL